jgi:hypothetical protein
MALSVCVEAYTQMYSLAMFGTEIKYTHRKRITIPFFVFHE